MPRRKNAPLNSLQTTKAMADVVWPVYEAYEVRSRKLLRKDTLHQSEIDLLQGNNPAQFFLEHVSTPTITVTSREIVDEIDLSDSNAYRDLYVDYLKIKDQNDALSYVRNHGFPCTFERIPGHSPINNFCIVSDILKSAAYLRWLGTLSKDITEENIAKLSSYIRESEIGGGHFLEINLRSPEETSIYPFETRMLNGSHIFSRAIDEGLMYPREWRDNKNRNKILYVAEEYFARALRRLLTGIQPILETKETTSGGRILAQSVLIESPWQAICYALLLNFTNTRYIGVCEFCGSILEGRADKKFCKPSCRKAYKRKHPDRSFRSYTTRKEN